MVSGTCSCLSLGSAYSWAKETSSTPEAARASASRLLIFLWLKMEKITTPTATTKNYSTRL